jgi:hypothetical protein
MSVLYPRLPQSTARERYGELMGRNPADLANSWQTSHSSQYFAATGGSRASTDVLARIRSSVRDIAVDYGFPEEPIGRAVNRFDVSVAEVLHTGMGIVPAEAAVRPIWAFLALMVLPDVAVWRFPNPPKDRVLATDITRHVFGRLWWRAELLRDDADPEAPFRLLNVFSERNFDQILARRRSLGGSRELVRALAKEWPTHWIGSNETEVLRETLKHLMRRGAFQDLFGLPEPLLRAEIAETIHTVRTTHSGR